MTEKPRIPGASPPRIMVVILNWNGREDTLRCVQSVLSDGIPASDIVVVDNGSTDGSTMAFSLAFPKVMLVQNRDNLGFSGGMNVGIRYCLLAHPEFICIMNNDTVVTVDMFQNLAAVATPTTAVSPEVRYRDKPDRIWFGGGVLERDSFWPRHLTPSELRTADSRDPAADSRISETLAGCCILAHSAVWRTVGLFDERYFLLFEDADWSARARAQGVTLAVVKHAILLHAVSASFNGPGRMLGSYYYARNGLTFGRRQDPRQHLAHLRFVRDQIARPALRDLRNGPLVRRLAALFSGLGLLASCARMYGRAPAWLENLAVRLT